MIQCWQWMRCKLLEREFVHNIGHDTPVPSTVSERFIYTNIVGFMEAIVCFAKARGISRDEIIGWAGEMYDAEAAMPGEPLTTLDDVRMKRSTLHAESEAAGITGGLDVEVDGVVRCPGCWRETT